MSRPDLVYSVVVGHSLFMLRFWGWGWVLLALLTIGCSSQSADEGQGATGGPYGGQTGSLAPSCGTTRSFTMQATLPTGDTAFVYYDDACATDETDFALHDANGDAIDFHLEELEGGVVLKANEALTTGVYSVTTPEGTKTVIVTDPEPIPMNLGTLTLDAGGCSPSFTLTFSEEIGPYLPLLSLSVTVDGVSSGPWFDYGTIIPDYGRVRLVLNELSWLGSLQDGSHQVVIQADIAGESARPDALTMTFETLCEDSGDGGGGCAVVAARPFVPRGWGAWAWAGLLVFGLGGIVA